MSTKSKGLLNGWFQKPFWNTRIKSANVTKKELWLGYVAGPFGAMLLQSIVNSYFNQYLTDVLGFTVSRGAWIASFMIIFPLVSKVIDAITNVLMAKVIDNTSCRQGKLRPWFILSLPIMIVSLLLMFWIPFQDAKAQAIWIIVSYNIFYSVGYTMWYMSYELSAALSTRNFQQRKSNSMAGQITKNMGTGLISILFPTILAMVVRMAGGSNQEGYLLCMAMMCGVAIPLTFLQYFYTRERITEERRLLNEENDTKVEEASFKEQFKTCIKDKYWIILVCMLLVYQVLNGMKNVSQIYYAGWVVNGNAYGEYAAIQAKFQMIAMAPMGPALFILLPLFKKLGRRKVIIGGSVLAFVGSLVAFMGAGNTGAVYGGTAIGSLGTMTFTYSLFTWVGDVIDHVEYKNKLRVEGFTAALIGFAEMFSKGIGQSLFNAGLAATKYTTPEVIGSFVNEKGKEILLYADQTKAATQWINFSFQGSFILMGVLFFIIFVFFFKIENEMPHVQAELENRKIEECKLKGIEYIPQSVQEKLEKEQQKAEAEENRIKELKAKCAKNGKDFEKENQKVLDKRAKKEAKKAAKKAKKAAKKAK